jgi:hypothetical protein
MEKKLGVVVHACHPNNGEKHIIGQLGQKKKKTRPYFQNNQSKKGWRCGSNNRTASQA